MIDKERYIPTNRQLDIANSQSFFFFLLQQARVQLLKSESASPLFPHSCPALWDSMDCGLPGSSVHGILQTRVLEWVAIPFSRVSPQPKA